MEFLNDMKLMDLKIGQTIMKSFSLIFAAIVLGAASQMASAGPDVSSHDASQSVGGQEKDPHGVFVDDFYKFSGSYDLANGKSLTLFTRLGEMYAVVQGEARQRLAYAGKNTFVSKDKTMKIRIDFQKDGQAEGELYLFGGAPNLAKATVEGEKIAISSRP